MSEQDSVSTPNETLASDDWRKRYPDFVLTPEQAHRQAVLKDKEQEFIARQRACKIDSLAHKLGKRYTPKRCNLDTFTIYDDKQRDVVQRLRALAPTFPEFVRAGRGLVFYGSVGTGKDHLLAACLYAACSADLSCHWINGPDLFGAFRDAMDTDRQECEIMNELTQPDVLGLSDPIPPIGDPNAWRVETLYRVIDARYRLGKAIWVSVNALTPDEADAKLSAPVFDRIRHDAEMFPCFWPSFRERVGKGK